MVLYPDLAFLLNSLTDLMALIATARLAGLPLRWKRLLPAAALGGLYGALCLLPPCKAAGGVLWQALAAALLIWVAFGVSSLFFRQLLLFWLLSCMLGGALLAAEELAQQGWDWKKLGHLDWKVFFLVGGGCYGETERKRKPRGRPSPPAGGSRLPEIYSIQSHLRASRRLVRAGRQKHAGNMKGVA